MRLPAGTRIGAYEVLGLLGSGGMGEVYHARDSRLAREVALKILPDSVATDPERLARFDREAKTLASLNHPNIAQIFEAGRAPSDSGKDIAFLALELVPGPTLADRIAVGALSIDEALAIARQIVGAVEAAHEQGVIHRDLKPANIKVREDGTVKVLDFGLAKALQPQAASIDARNSPTMTAKATEMGVILGTAAYMSPEQAKGKAADQRADIWSFGVVLFEMIAGKPVFTGETASEVMASVMKEEPNWALLPTNLSPTLRRVLRRCLEKDPKKRMSAMSDVRLELSERDVAHIDVPVTWPRRRMLELGVAALVGAVITGIGAYGYFGRPAPVVVATAKFHVAWPIEPGHQPMGGSQFFQISPDGRYLAIVNENALWVRSLAEFEPVRLDHTQGAVYPFWSPNSEEVGFFQSGQLMVIPRAGGSPRLVCAAPNSRGGAWSRTGTIVFSQDFGRLWQVPEQGGAPQGVKTQWADDPVSGRYPQFLPDGKRFLYLRLSTKPDIAGVYVGSLAGMTPVRILDGSESALFARSGDGGYLLFRRGDTLMAQPFDADRLKLSGTAFPVATDVGGFENTGHGAFSVSDAGTLAVAPVVTGESDLAWLSRAGIRGTTIAAKLPVGSFAFSPDQQRVAMEVGEGHDETDIWIQTIGASPSKFTFGPAPGWASPVWSPNGDEIAFATVDVVAPKHEVRKKRSDMSGIEETLFGVPADLLLWDWSKDGKYLVVGIGTELYLLPLGDHKPIQLTKSLEYAHYGQMSPNGRWIAYVSGPPDASQVYVQPIPPTGALQQISRGGATMPRWRRDGKELYYLAADGNLMAVAVNDNSDGLSFGTAEKLFPLPAIGGGGEDPYSYVPATDGSRFLVRFPSAGVAPPLTVVLNWRTK